MDDLASVRAWFAEEVRFAAGVKSEAVVRAFATVPRERFLGRGPWQIGTGAGLDKYWATADADPRSVYHNVVIGLLPEKGLNNGQPSFWAFLLDRLGLEPGNAVLHLGCGAGYYSAIVAELVGPTGRVTAIDLEAELVARARQALAPWPQVGVHCADATAYAPDAPVDAIVVSAGATHPQGCWLDALAPGGKLLMPLTGERGWGRMLLVTRAAAGDGLAARLVGGVGIYHCAGARDAGAAARLDAAFAGGDTPELKSLRREPHAPDDGCWLHGDGFCLSRAEPGPVGPGSASPAGPVARSGGEDPG
jgi:protein-L-isoaspartate(D-aspartate) O-methyltransferase